MNITRSKYIYILIAALSILAAVFFGSRKRGYYIDEYYTYTLSNGTQLGIAVDNGAWQDTSEYLSQLAAEGDERFRFGAVYENNANDVHPPLYYFLIHLVSSFFPGVFSKWTGIGVNLFLFVFCLMVASLISREIARGDERLSLIAFVAYALSPATLSGIMLIRMYVQLALFVMLYAYIVIRDIDRDKISVRGFLIPVFVTGFFGFLTQYYFVIAMFFMTFFYCLYLLIRREIRRMLAFGAAALSSLIATLFVWRVSIFHIFKGYRGADSVSSLMSTTNISSRVLLFVGNLSKNVYGGMLPVVIIMLTIGIILLVIKRERTVDIKFAHLALSALCYFLIIAKIGLKAGDASNRYEYPVYGILIILTAAGIYKVVRSLFGKDMALLVTALLMALFCISGYATRQVLYLYPQEKNLEDFIDGHREAELMVFHRDDGRYDTRIKDYLKRERVYWVRCLDEGDLEDGELRDAKELIVYVDKKSDMTECFRLLLAAAPDLTEKEHIFTTPGDEFEVYYFHD